MFKRKELSKEENIIEGELYVEMKYLTENMRMDKTKDLSEKDEYFWQANPLDKQVMVHYKLNTKYLYFLSEVDMKGVISGIALEDLVNRADRVAEGQCCLAIGQVEGVVKYNYNFKGYCMQLELPKQQWQLCTDSQHQLLQMRTALVRQVIQHWWKVHLPNQVMPSYYQQPRECSREQFDWSISSQQQWPCTACQTGREQSPVELDQTTCHHFSHGQTLQLQFNTLHCIHYYLTTGGEPVFKGAYGGFTFHSVSTLYSYNMYQLQWKLGAGEHTIKQHTHYIQAELLVYAATKQGRQAILSFLIEVKDGEPNPFVEQLKVSSWTFLRDNTPQVLRADEPHPSYNLGMLLQQNTDDTDNSQEQSQFYYYRGSLSKPPCTEQVDRFILEKVVYINYQQYSQLQLYGQQHLGLGPTIRRQQPLNSRTVYCQSLCLQWPQPQQSPVPKCTYIHAAIHQTIYAMQYQDQGVIQSLFQQMGEQTNNNNNNDNNKVIKVGPNIELKAIDKDQVRNQIPDYHLQKLYDQVKYQDQQ